MTTDMQTNADLQNHLRNWYLATRPRSLTATYVPIALGGVLAFADETFHLLHIMLALIGVLFLQISANLLNEYYDYIKGSDKQKTHGLGMIIARGLISPRRVLIGGVLTLVLGSLIGLYFVAATGPLVLLIGIGGVLAVVLYTAGPYPLAYIGLGEITVFVFMGPLIVIGAYFVQANDISAAAIWGGIPIAFLVANILHANNLRDLEADRAEGKHTLATIFGRRFARNEYTVLTLGGYVTTLVLIVTGIAPVTTLAILLTLPEALRLLRTARTSTDTAELHKVLLGTARLHRWFGSAFVVGWLVGVIVL